MNWNRTFFGSCGYGTPSWRRSTKRMLEFTKLINTDQMTYFFSFFE